VEGVCKQGAKHNSCMCRQAWNWDREYVFWTEVAHNKTMGCDNSITALKMNENDSRRGQQKNNGPKNAEMAE